MRTLALALLALFVTTSAMAQTTVDARTAVGAGDYRFVQAIQEFDNGLLTGGGYTDRGDVRDYTNTGGWQDGYGGMGYAFMAPGDVAVKALAFVNQGNGDGTADSRTSVMPWVLASRAFGKVNTEANYYAFRHVGGEGGDVVHVLEHAKAEYALGDNWLAGVGDAAVGSGGVWDNTPFVTVTRKMGVGNMEVWFQRPNGENAVQVRFHRGF